MTKTTTYRETSQTFYSYVMIVVYCFMQLLEKAAFDG